MEIRATGASGVHSRLLHFRYKKGSRLVTGILLACLNNNDFDLVQVSSGGSARSSRVNFTRGEEGPSRLTSGWTPGLIASPEAMIIDDNRCLHSCTISGRGRCSANPRGIG